MTNWKTERGLSNNTILSMAQDRSGYLWIGTADGLVRFDGVNFSIFTGEQQPAFRDNYISNLLVDRSGTLWIGTLHGQMLSLEQGGFLARPLETEVASIAFQCLAEDGQGTLFLGTSSGLFSLGPERKGPFKKRRDFPDVQIQCLLLDDSGRLLVSTESQGLFCLEKGRFQTFLPMIDKSDHSTNVMLQDRNGSLWLGTEKGLFQYKDNKLRHYPFRPGMTSEILAMIEDRDGNLWLGSQGGLYRYRDGRFQLLSQAQGLSSDFVYSLCEDAEGSLWVGTVEGGLTQLRDEKISVFGRTEGLGFGLVRCIHEDEAGAVWASGYGGFLSRLWENRIDNFSIPDLQSEGDAWSLEPEAGGGVWLGSDHGLQRFQNKRMLDGALPAEAAAASIRCVFKDRSGLLWVAAWDVGLLCRKDGRTVAYSTVDDLPDRQVNVIYEDKLGNLWVGSETGACIARRSGDGTFSFKTVLRDCQALSFYEDSGGSIWVGTRRHGLKILKNGRWGGLNTDQGLFDNRVYVILEDGLGYLWMSSERGIFRAEKNELEKAAFDPARQVRGRLFDENDGMKSRVCNDGQPAGWKSADGRLWFATLKGIAVIDPSRLHANDRVPPVLVEEIVVDNRSLPTAGNSLAQPLKLTAGSKRFEFKYTALSFIRSDKIMFKYKLEGYDKDWTSAGGRREAFYNDLRPGRYTFRVIAANADGVWNTAGATFAFFLRPFVYQTWWFMVLAALAFAIVSALSWQLLKKYLRAMTFWKKKTHIGHFKILETIGTGGMATVYKAQDMLDKKRLVALKVLKEENFHDENQKKRFKHESLITEQLDHPHIVHIIERGEMDDCWYIAMELLHGRSLARLIRDEGRLEVAAALDIMLQVVDALHAIHGQNIVHRDLKPDNIMISEGRGRPYFVKLLDFGLAISPAQSRLTMSGVVMGTIRYLPPERISDGASSPAGDIYSAGIILYEMLTGSKPFWSEATGEVIHRILATYPIATCEINPNVPPDLEVLIKAMIDKDPIKRPALDVIESELQRLAEEDARR